MFITLHQIENGYFLKVNPAILMNARRYMKELCRRTVCTLYTQRLILSDGSVSQYLPTTPHHGTAGTHLKHLLVTATSPAPFVLKLLGFLGFNRVPVDLKLAVILEKLLISFPLVEGL